MNPLPITVLLPTRDAMSMLPSHVRAMREWSALAREILVIDSESKDGTVDHIREHLKHSNLSVHARPPGLYQAWNYGVTRASSEYIYVSTVGDVISSEGLTHLYEVARQFRTPVTLSEPELVESDGSPSGKIWPVGEIIRDLGITSPGVLSKAVSFIYAATSIPKSTLGSSASNLYVTDFLRRHPFPCDYGLSGDVALGVAQSLTEPFAVTPRKCATFVFHEKTYSKKEYEVNDLSLRLGELARKSLDAVVANGSPVDPELWEATTVRELEELLEELRVLHLARQRVKVLRFGTLPWRLNPVVWWARRVRRQRKSAMQQLKRRLIERLVGKGGTP